MASNSIDTFKDVELDSLMSLLGDDEMLPLPCEDSGCGLSMNDSGTTLDSLDDVMEFHDCFDSLPDDFDAIPQFNMVDDAGIIPIEPTNVPSTSSIEPSTSSIVPTNVPSSIFQCTHQCSQYQYRHRTNVCTTVKCTIE